MLIRIGHRYHYVNIRDILGWSAIGGIVLAVAAFLFFYAAPQDQHDRDVAQTIDVRPLMTLANGEPQDAYEGELVANANALCKADPRVNSWGLCGQALADRARAEALKDQVVYPRP